MVYAIGPVVAIIALKCIVSILDYEYSGISVMEYGRE